MRKFFKSLAVLLALVLIVGVIPAAAADSLSMQKEKVLYLDGSKGAKEDGTKCKTSYKKLVANMIKGFDKDTMSVVLSSADKDIVKTSKAGRIFAKSLGTTTVTVKVLNADEEQIFQQDLKVKVKKNATDITVTGIADGDNFSVGQTVDVTLPRLGVDTDEREFKVDNAEIAEVKTGEKARTYTVKFLKEGTVTFTARAYQSAKYPADTATKKEIKVTVGNPVPTEVNVVASNAFELKFAEDVQALGLFKDAKAIADDAVYWLSNDVKVPFTGVKEVKASGNVVKVTMFNNFTSGTTYYVDVNGSKDLSFVVAGNAAKDVTSIAILKTSVVVNDSTDITVALYNKDGVDITNTAYDGTNITLTSSDQIKLWAEGGLKVSMYNVGDVAELTATFTYYDEQKNYEATTLKDTKAILCVAQAVAEKTGIIYTIGTDKNKPKHYLALGEPNKLYFNAWLKETLNGNTVDKQVGVQAFGSLGATYARVADPAIASIVADHDGTNGYEIVGNQVGSTYVFICYTKDNKEVIFDTCPIEVRAQRYANTVTLSASKSNVNKSSLTEDEIKITAKVTDQYGDPIDKTPEFDQQLENSKDKSVVTLKPFGAGTNPGEFVATLKSSDFDYKKDGAIVLSVKAGDKSNKPNVSFNVASKGAIATAYDFSADKTSMDTSIKFKTSIAKATVSFTGVNSGYFTSSVGILGTAPFTALLTGNTDAPTNNSVKNCADGFVLDIKKDNKRLNLDSTIADGVTVKYRAFFDANSLDLTDGKIELANLVVDGGVIYKLPKGNYTFELYVIKEGKISGNIRRVNISVTDNQVVPTFTKVFQKLADVASIEECFRFSFDDKTQSLSNVNNRPLTDVDTFKAVSIPAANMSVDTNKNTFVKSANVTLAIDDNNGNDLGDYTINVPINTIIYP